MIASLSLPLLTTGFLLLAAVSLRFVLDEPWNVSAGLAVLCVLFFLFPALAWMYGFQASFEYGFSTIGTDVLFEDDYAALAWSMVMTGLLLAGGLSARSRGGAAGDVRPGGALRAAPTPSRGSNEMLVLLGAIWLLLMAVLQHSSGLSPLEIILPFRKAKADVYGSFYVLYLAMYIPAAIGAVLAVRQHWSRRCAWVGFALALAVALGSGQRRNVLIIVLFGLALAATRRWAAPVDRAGGPSLRGPPAQKKRPSWLALSATAAVCLVLGPVLWWMRNWFTGILDPWQELVPPWERKSFVQLLFGSASAGFPTFLLVREWVALDGVQWGTSLLATLCVVVPRPVWPGKPVGAELLLQQRFSLPTMPSMFLLNELYLNAGMFCLPLAFAVGRTLSRIHRYCGELRSPMARIALAAMMANLVTAFKNGLGPFTINVVFLLVLCRCGMWRGPAASDAVRPPVRGGGRGTGRPARNGPSMPGERWNGARWRPRRTVPTRGCPKTPPIASSGRGMRHSRDVL